MQNVERNWQEWGINHNHCVGCDNIWRKLENSTCECADLIAHHKGD